MADANTELKQMAVQIANELEGRNLALKRELIELESKYAEKKAEIEAIGFPHERARDFIPSLGGDYLCPACWVHSQRQSRLRPVDNPDSQDDIFTCRECGNDFVFAP